MTAKRRTLVLLLLPLLFFAMGALIANLSTRTAILVAPNPANLLDAAIAEQHDAVFELVVAGEDPGLATALQRPAFHWKRDEMVSPLMIAVAYGEQNEVAYLAKHTQHLNSPPNDQLLCIAARYGHANLGRFLMKMGVAPVPKDGCGEMRFPEQIAKKYGSGRLSRELRAYRENSR